MQIVFNKKFVKQYNKSPQKIQKAFDKRLKIFIKNPIDHRLNNHPLGGKYQDKSSINITGDWRAVFEKFDGYCIEFFSLELIVSYMVKKTNKILPSHIAFIVDGNRRWAQKRGLPAGAGHMEATNKTIETLIFHSIKLGIPYLTFWAFSTENWKRGQRFAGMLFKILETKMTKGVEKYNKAGIRLRLIGDISKLPAKLTKTLQKWEKDSAANSKITVIIALNYGGRDELLRAIKRVIETPGVEDLKKTLEQKLDTVGIPDPDLIIRTGGEKRLSGFLPWQSIYSELYFTDTLFPDFTPQRLDEALLDYQNRQRRFGK